jgi:ribosomal protein L12E/L44/L45/RPP1/RPP2
LILYHFISKHATPTSILSRVNMTVAGEVDMKIDPVRAKSLVQALQDVSGRVSTVAKGRDVSIR